MVLVDTSVWIDHLRRGNGRFAERLVEGAVAVHPFVVGELACGNISNRNGVLSLLGHLPEGLVAGHEEVLAFIDANGLHGIGLGYVDAHLLASALLTGIPLWTLDKRLAKTARELGAGFS